MKYFDTHAHVTSEYYKQAEKASLLNDSYDQGVVKVIIPGTTKEDSLEAISMADEGHIFAAAGIHPVAATDTSVWNFLQDIDLKSIVAIGEIGIDLYRDTNPPLEIQREVFIRQLMIAEKNNLPALIHMRNSEEEIYEILSRPEFQNLKFVLHSFGSTVEWAKKFEKLGAYISISGIVTFKNAKELKEVAKYYPLDRLLVETDTPYLTPEPNRGKSNKPEYVIYTAQYVASLREETNKEVIDALYTNGLKLFNIE